MAEQKQDDPIEHTYIQLCEDTGCSPEDLPEAMNDRENGVRVSGISALAGRHDDDDDDGDTAINTLEHMVVQPQIYECKRLCVYVCVCGRARFGVCVCVCVCVLL